MKNILIIENNMTLGNMLIKFIIKNFPKTTFIIAKSVREGLNMIEYQFADAIIVGVGVERKEIILVFFEESYYLYELKKILQEINKKRGEKRLFL